MSLHSCPISLWRHVNNAATQPQNVKVDHDKVIIKTERGITSTSAQTAHERSPAQKHTVNVMEAIPQLAYVVTALFRTQSHRLSKQRHLFLSATYSTVHGKQVLHLGQSKDGTMCSSTKLLLTERPQFRNSVDAEILYIR